MYKAIGLLSGIVTVLPDGPKPGKIRVVDGKGENTTLSFSLPMKTKIWLNKNKPDLIESEEPILWRAYPRIFRKNRNDRYGRLGLHLFLAPPPDSIEEGEIVGRFEAKGIAVGKSDDLRFLSVRIPRNEDAREKVEDPKKLKECGVLSIRTADIDPETIKKVSVHGNVSLSLDLRGPNLHALSVTPEGKASPLKKKKAVEKPAPKYRRNKL